MTKRRLILLLLAISCALWIFGCGSSSRRDVLSAEEHFEKAKKYFDEEKYLKALDEFTIIVYQYSGHAIIDDAQYYLAECHYNIK